MIIFNSLNLIFQFILDLFVVLNFETLKLRNFNHQIIEN